MVFVHYTFIQVCCNFLNASAVFNTLLEFCFDFIEVCRHELERSYLIEVYRDYIIIAEDILNIKYFHSKI
jgi:hypothetical protein